MKPCAIVDEADEESEKGAGKIREKSPIFKQWHRRTMIKVC